MVPLLPKLRGHFAEFLNHSSLDRLGILYLTTCVGLGYGPCVNSLEAFLGSIGSLTSPQRVRITSHTYRQRIYLLPVLHAYTSTTIGWHSYLPASPHRLATTSSGPAHPVHDTPKGVLEHSGRLVSLIHHGRAYTGTGISTRCPSTTPVGLALGPDSPWAD